MQANNNKLKRQFSTEKRNVGNMNLSNATNRLKCIYMNARSIVNKLSELELCIEDEKPDILGITETWLHSGVTDSELNFDGYTLFRNDRNDPEKSRGGGVLFYVKNELNPTIIAELKCDKIETLFCNVQCKEGTTMLGICYRPPDTCASIDENFYNLLNCIDSKYLVLMGDFNYSGLNWLSDSTVDRSHPFVECLDNNYLSQLVDKPSRGSNYLDLVIASDTSTIEDLALSEPFDTSDHQMITFYIIGSINHKTKGVKIYNYFKADYDKIRKDIKDLRWGELTMHQDVNCIWNKLKSDILDVRDKSIGVKGKTRNKCKWANKRVQRFRRRKKEAWIKYQKSNKSTELYEEYKKKLNMSVKENKKAREEFEQRLADNIKVDCKSFYSYVNSKSRSSNKIGPLKDANRKLIAGNKETADFLNNYFSNVFTEEDLVQIPTPVNNFDCNINEALMNIEITESDVLAKLSKINVGKSIGSDEVHGKFIYEIRHELAKPLAHLFNLSVKTGIVPQDWRDANVIPLFKKGSRGDAQNYRPVSLLSIVGKLLESFVKEHLVGHLEKYNLIKDSQHGFYSGRSCLTNLLEFFENATNDLDQNKAVDLIYLDFCKAFDKVPHCRLAKKLEANGVRGGLLEWIKAWLSQRRQRVSIEGEFSEWAKVTSGVPQGSVLGPILFLVYINDLDTGIVSRLGKFADDSKLLKSIENNADVEVLREDLQKLELWAKTWQMEFNTEKCSVMHLGNHNECANYSLFNKPLMVSEKERDLGVIVDNKLKFSEQCDAAVSKANSALGMIKRNVVSRNHKTITKFYKALVRPKLEYCVQAWRPYLRKDIDKIERVQRRATKLIAECRNLPYEDRLKYTGLTTLEARRDRGDMIEVFKLMKGITKVDSNKLFHVNSNSRTRGHSYKLDKSRPRLDIRKNYFSHRIVNKWNTLPTYVIESDSVNAFKNRYDKTTNK